MAGEGGAALAGQIDRYIAILEACLAEIPIAAASGDLASVRRNAHAIAGDAHLVEADALAACAGEIENAVKAGDIPAVRKLIDRLREEAARVIDQLNCEAHESRSSDRPAR